MKSQILKIAGVKDEASFYKKFPTEEAFMKKHGKAFLKAQNGLQAKGLSPLSGAAQLPTDFNLPVGFNQKPGVGDYLDAYGGDALNLISGVAGGLSELKAEKEKLNQVKQQRKISDLYLKASGTREEMPERRYVRPEDIQNTGEEFFPIYGVGTNVLAKDGIYIKPENRGKFNATKKRTGKTTEELTHSKNPLTRKRAIFAQNAAKWKKGQDGLDVSDIQSINQASGIQFTPEGANQLFMKDSNQYGDFPELNMLGLESIYDVSVDASGRYSLKPNKKNIRNAAAYKNDVLRISKANPNSSLSDLYTSGSYQSQTQRRPMNYLQPINNEGKLASNDEMKWGGKMKYQNGGFANFLQQQNVGGVADKLIGAGFNNSGGYQIGSSIGNAVKAIPGVGTVAGAVAAPVLGAIGGALDQAFGPAGKIKKEQEKLDRNITGIVGNTFGKSLSNQYGGFMKKGGSIKQHSNMDGDLQVYGGSAHSLSYNPFLPDGGETIMFNGPSHAEGGMPISYGNTPVEVEGGEPAVKLEHGGEGENLTVFGNLKIPKGFDGEGKKFKNYVDGLSKIENKQNNILDKSSEELDSLDVITSFDKLKLESLKANTLGANMKLKDVADKKMKAADLQNAINITAEEFGLEADALAKGKVKKAKYGAMMKASDFTAQDGKKITKSEAQKLLKQGWKQDPDNPNRIYKKGQPEKIIEGTPGSEAEYETINQTSGEILKQYQNRMSDEDWKKYLANETPEQKAARHAREINEGYRAAGDVTEKKLIKEAIPGTPDQVIPGTPDQSLEWIDPKLKEVPYKRSWAMDAFNEVLPFIRPTDAEPLSGNQLLGEQYALATNQLEPVQAQGYYPELDVPYDISLQDQINTVTDESRAAQKFLGYNPAAQVGLAGQAYGAKNRILGEQFRLNQAKKDSVYSGNRATMNDAKLKNLDIFDRQYTRQAQAKSNTKDVAQAALNSISSKYAQNQLENRTLQTYENLYNYRYGANGRLQNWNGFYQPTVPTVGAVEGQGQVPIYDSEGNITGYQLTPTKKAPSMATPGYNPSARNGSIIKAIKNL